MRSPEAGQLPCSHRTSAAVKLRGISAASNNQNVARCGQPTSQMALEPNWLQTHTGYEERLTFKHVVPGTTSGPHQLFLYTPLSPNKQRVPFLKGWIPWGVLPLYLEHERHVS